MADANETLTGQSTLPGIPPGLPNVQRLWDAVNEYQRDCREAMREFPRGDFAAKFEAARTTFRSKCRIMGIEAAFDWSEES